MREAFRDLTSGIRLRALIAAWSLTLVAVAILVLADASPAVVSLVMGGAAAVVVLCVAGSALTTPSSVAASLMEAAPPIERRPPVEPRPEPDPSRSSEPTVAPQQPKKKPPKKKPSDMDAKMLLAANLRRLRKERCWSQEMLAHFVGVHPTEIARLERGLREPRLRTVLQVAAVLKVSVSELLHNPEEREEDERTSVSPPRSHEDRP